MKMVRYKRLLVAACVFAALSVSTVSAADTATLNEKDLVIDKTTTEAGEQVLPEKKNLEEVEQTRTGSIEVVLTDGKAGTDKSNVKIRCQKVSEIVQGEYVLLKSYKDAGVDLNAIENSNDLKNAAEQLLSKAEESTNTNVTDANGTVTFKNLEVGVYLISAEDTERYDTVEPSLIAVPTWSDSEGEMQYDVVIEPKHTEKPDKEENTAPQTNLEENTWRYAGLAGICVVGALVCIIRMRKRKH